MNLTVFQFIYFVCILVNNVECVPVCKSRQYYSEDVPGCVLCPSKATCDDQYAPDIQRCKDACETKSTQAPQVPVTTEVSQNDTPKPTPSQPTKMSFKTVLEKIITPPSKTTGQPKRLDHPINLEQSEKTESSDNTGKLGLSVSLGVLATIVLCLFGFGVYKWYWSSHSSIVASRVDEGETIEIRDPSGTTIQESSFMARPSRSGQVNSDADINGIQPPLQETETLNLLRIPTAPENKNGSRLLVHDNEY